MTSRSVGRLVVIAGALAVALSHSFAHAAATIVAKHGNGTRASAQGVFVRPGLFVKQKLPNDTLQTAQPVGPAALGFPIDVAGTLSKAQPRAFFSFVASGAHLELRAKDPATQFPELLVYDDEGVVVAGAAGNDADGSSAIVDVSLGAPRLFVAEVTGSPAHPTPKAQLFKYHLHVAPTAQYVTVVGRVGSAKGEAPVGFYSFAANMGDHLHLQVSPDPPAQITELLLYDSNQNLVAIAANNGASAQSSVIDFTIPDFAAGTWTAEVTASPGAPPDAFDYSLTIKGATGTGPVVTN